MLTTRMRFIALGAAVAFLSIAVAGPAVADDGKKAGSVCWADTDRGVTQCFADADAMEDAVYAQTGAVLVREGSTSARPAGTRALFVIAELFVNASYGGGVTTVSNASSTVCASGSVSNNLFGAANNSTSSFKSYFGCVTTIFDLAGQAGTSYGPFINAPSVGGMNDRASSYTVT